MRATAKCPKCKELLTTDCGGCIRAGTCLHKCKGKKDADVIDVRWKVYPETEKELLDEDLADLTEMSGRIHGGEDEK